MNQTKKRLTIINLAISITDIDTIQLQTLKLAPLSSDKKIEEILNTLHDENYGQAQKLITAYIDTPNETIVQRTQKDELPQTEDELKRKEEQAIIEEFDLFTSTPQENIEDIQQDANYDDFLNVTPQVEIEEESQPEEKTTNFETLLNVDANDVLPNNIDLDINQETTEINVKEEEEILQEDLNSEETSTEPTTPLLAEDDKEIENTVEDIEELTQEDETILSDNTDEEIQETLQEDTSETDIEEDEIQTPEETDDKVSEPIQEDEKPLLYDPIPHISSKFNHIYNQYPPIEHTVNRFFSVENWLSEIAANGYSEADIEARIKDADKLKGTNLAESAQLLIAAASTESLYALFRLARALYVGDILQKNVHEAATIIHYLAKDESYPEAICDLAQLYESGVEVEKNKKKAQELYKKAMNLGIHRAIKHYERVKQENKSIFSKFLK